MSRSRDPATGASTTSSVTAPGGLHLRYRVSPPRLPNLHHRRRQPRGMLSLVAHRRGPLPNLLSTPSSPTASSALGRGWADAREGDWAEIKHSGSRLPATARRQTTVPQADGLARWARVGGSDPHEAQPTGRVWVLLVLSALSRGPCGRSSGESSPVRWSGRGEARSEELRDAVSRVLIAGVRNPLVLCNAIS